MSVSVPVKQESWSQDQQDEHASWVEQGHAWITSWWDRGISGLGLVQIRAGPGRGCTAWGMPACARLGSPFWWVGQQNLAWPRTAWHAVFQTVGCVMGWKTGLCGKGSVWIWSVYTAKQLLQVWLSVTLSFHLPDQLVMWPWAEHWTSVCYQFPSDLPLLVSSEAVPQHHFRRLGRVKA